MIRKNLISVSDAQKYLAPCPFCGSTEFNCFGLTTMDLMVIHCKGCPGKMSMDSIDNCWNDIIDCWNKRVKE